MASPGGKSIRFRDSSMAEIRETESQLKTETSQSLGERRLDLDGETSEDIDEPQFLNQQPETSQLSYERNLETLNFCVESIKGQFAHVLNKHEQDFIRAYKSYMEKVQKELGFWSKHLEETVGKRVIELFMSEAESINRSLELQKREYRDLQAECAGIKKERRVCKEKIKEEMRENKQISIAVTKQLKKNDVIKEFLELNEKKPTFNISLNDRLQSKSEVKEPAQSQATFKYSSKLSGVFQTRKASEANVIGQQTDGKVSKFILQQFEHGMTKEEVEQKVLGYFKKLDKKKDKTIKVKNSRLNSLRQYNFRAKSSQAQGYSEKAEIEELFLDCVEEIKKGLSKKRSSNLAFQTTLKSQGSSSPFELQRISNYMLKPHTLLIEQVVQQKFTLMEVFDELFGYGGYSGIAFQQYQRKIKEKQNTLGFGIDTSSAISTHYPQGSEHQILSDVGQVQDYIEPISNNTGPLDNLITLSKRNKARQYTASHGAKAAPIDFNDPYSGATNYTSSQRAQSTVGGQRRNKMMEEIKSTSQVDYLNSTLFQSPMTLQDGRAQTQVNFYKDQNEKYTNLIHSNDIKQHQRNITEQVNTFQLKQSDYGSIKPFTAPVKSNRRGTSISIGASSTKKPFQVRNGKLIITTIPQFNQH